VSDWNPTDDELRAIAGDTRCYADSRIHNLARLVLRERENVRGREYDRAHITATMHRHAENAQAQKAAADHFEDLWQRAEAELVQARAALARVEALCDERENAFRRIGADDPEFIEEIIAREGAPVLTGRVRAAIAGDLAEARGGTDASAPLEQLGSVGGDHDVREGVRAQAVLAPDVHLREGPDEAVPPPPFDPDPNIIGRVRKP